MPFPESNSVWKEQHPDEGMLHEWLEEQLDTEAAARVDAHVSTCESCRARVAEAHGLIAASRRILTSLDDVPGGVIPTIASVTRVPRDAHASVTAGATAGSAAGSVDATTTMLSSSTASVSAASGTSPAKRIAKATSDSFRWRRWGSVAAVLVLGATGFFVVATSGSDVTIRDMPANQTATSAPLPAPEKVAESVVAPAAPAPAANAATTAATTSRASASAGAPAGAKADASARAGGATAREPERQDAKVAAKRTAMPDEMLATQRDARSEARATTRVDSVSTATPRGNGGRAQANANANANANAAGVVTAGAAAAAAPPIVTSSNGDTLAQRLERERRKAATAEAIAADANNRPRIDPLPVTAKLFSTADKQRGATIGAAGSGVDNAARTAPRSTPPPTSGASSIPGQPPASIAPPSFDSLALMREPCFGRCPAYQLNVDATGHVRYRSQHPDDNGRTYSADMPGVDVARLRELIARARVDSLKSYMPNLPTCGRDATDMPTLHLTVFRRERVIVLDQYMGCSNGTKDIPTLMREIDSIVGTQRWLPTGYKLN